MKKTKLNFIELSNICDYYDFVRYEFENKKGYIYKIDKITIEQEEKINSYKNTKIFKIQSQYAPELKKYGVFLADKNFK